MKTSTCLVLAAALVAPAAAGPATWGLCHSACNAGWVTCCAAAGAVAGEFLGATIAGKATPPPCLTMTDCTHAYRLELGECTLGTALMRHRHLYARPRRSRGPRRLFGRPGRVYGRLHPPPCHPHALGAHCRVPAQPRSKLPPARRSPRATPSPKFQFLFRPRESQRSSTFNTLTTGVPCFRQLSIAKSYATEAPKLQYVCDRPVGAAASRSLGARLPVRLTAWLARHEFLRVGGACRGECTKVPVPRHGGVLGEGGATRKRGVRGPVSVSARGGACRMRAGLRTAQLVGAGGWPGVLPGWGRPGGAGLAGPPCVHVPAPEPGPHSPAARSCPVPCACGAKALSSCSSAPSSSAAPFSHFFLLILRLGARPPARPPARCRGIHGAAWPSGLGTIRRALSCPWAKPGLRRWRHGNPNYGSLGRPMSPESARNSYQPSKLRVRFMYAQSRGPEMPRSCLRLGFWLSGVQGRVRGLGEALRRRGSDAQCPEARGNTNSNSRRRHRLRRPERWWPARCLRCNPSLRTVQ